MCAIMMRVGAVSLITFTRSGSDHDLQLQASPVRPQERHVRIVEGVSTCGADEPVTAVGRCG